MKALKIALFIFIGLIAFLLILAGIGTIGLKEARELKIKSIHLSSIEDGEYTGIYKNGRWSNTVEVTVKDHELVKIEHISTGNNSQIEVLNQIIDEVISQQKVDIDTVSGATATTNSLLKAIENALDK